MVNDLNLIPNERFEKILNRLEAFLSQPSASSKKVLVIGDIGLDEYLFGSVDRISPEAPVPVLKLSETEVKLGLAGNVAKNIASLGGECDIMGLVGQDSAAQELMRIFKSFKGITPCLVTSESRPTVQKTRVLSKHHHLLRVDREQNEPLSENEFKSAQEKLAGLDWNQYSSVILEDYGKGFLTAELCQLVISQAKEYGVRILVDPSKGVQPKKFQGADFFKPNYSETLAYKERAAYSYDKEDLSYSEILDWLKKEGDFGGLISTLGADGMVLAYEGQQIRIPTFARRVFDVTGAGDTVIAALSYALEQGLEVDEACVFANMAAGYVVGEIGAVPCTIDNIHTQMKRFSNLV